MLLVAERPNGVDALPRMYHKGRSDTFFAANGTRVLQIGHVVGRALRHRAAALVLDLGGGDVAVAEEGLHLGDVHAGIQ